MDTEAEVIEPVEEVEAVVEPVEGEAEPTEAVEPVEEKPEPVKFDARQQEQINKIISEKTAKHKVREQQIRDELSQKAQEDVSRPLIPDLPDPFDDDYAEQVAARDVAIREAATFDAGQNALQHQRQQMQQQQQLQQQQELNTQIQTYSDNATKKGIKPEQLQVAGNIVAQMGLRDDVVKEILSEADGPAMTMYLASNPGAIEQLNTAGNFNLGTIYNEIKANAFTCSIFPF